MITKEMLNATKRSDVSKNNDLTKERVSILWRRLSRSQRNMIHDYGITAPVISRIKERGNISVKVAAAIALVTGNDPFYLTAETDQIGIKADEARVRQFIIHHGYEKALEIGVSFAEDIEETPIESKANEKVAESSSNQIISLEEIAKMLLKNMLDYRLLELYSMSAEEVSSLTNALTYKAKYSDRAKDLLGLMRLILIE